MKDSGVEWIGVFPDEWTQIRLKDILVNRCGGAWGIEKQDNNFDTVCIRVADFNFEAQTIVEGEKTIRNYTLDQINRLKLAFGDILLEKSGGGEKTPVGRTILYNREDSCVYSNFIERLRPKEIVNNEYLAYLLKALYQSSYILIYTKQTTGIQNLDVESFLYEKICLPSFIEQGEIVSKLRKDCSKIDRLISLQEETIAELQAYKQSVITEAVTKGLDPDVPMKDSGVEWIGGIPEKWQLRKTTDVCSRITDFVASGSFADLKKNVEYLNEPDYAMLVRTTDVSEKGGDRKPVFINKKAYDFLSNSNLFGGELILPNIGTVGDIYVVPKLYIRMSLAPNAILIEPKVDSLYFYYYFKSCIGQEQLRSLSQSTAQPKFNKTQFSMIRMPVPPEDEMREISEHLDFKCKSIDQMISLKQTKLDTLKEYKKSLIYECVTGKREIV